MSDALIEAIQTRDVDRVAKLLADGADPNEDGKSRYAGYGSGRRFPLQTAIGELEELGEDHPAGSIDAVVLLLRHGAKVKGWDVDKEGDPLFLAVGMNHIEAVRLLLAHGAAWHLFPDCKTSRQPRTDEQRGSDARQRATLLTDDAWRCTCVKCEWARLKFLGARDFP